MATDLAPEFGREHVFQLKRVRQASARHALPATLGGGKIGLDETFFESNARLSEGWEFRVTKLSAEFTLEDWRAKNPEAVPFADLGPNGTLRLLGPEDKPKETEGTRLLVFAPKREERKDDRRDENGNDTMKSA